MTHMYLIKGIGVPRANTTITDYFQVFRIDNLNNLNWSIDTPVTPMPLPEDTHEENILVKMEGNTAKMDLSWTLTESTNFGKLEKDGGVYTFVDGEELTVYEEINLFKETFVPISIGDSYTMLITDDSGKRIMEDEGTISNMSFSVSGSSPIVWNVNCAFYVGNVVAMLEADIPPAPTHVLMAVFSGNQIRFTITAYDGYATEPAGGNAITGFAYKYKKILNASGVTDTIGTWSETIPITQDPASTNGLIYTFNPAGGAGNYKLKVAQTNGNNADANQYYWKYAKISGGDDEVTLTG